MRLNGDLLIDDDLTVTGDVIGATISGNIDGSSITSGTIPDARLPGNIMRSATGALYSMAQLFLEQTGYPALFFKSDLDPVDAKRFGVFGWNQELSFHALNDAQAVTKTVLTLKRTGDVIVGNHLTVTGQVRLSSVNPVLQFGGTTSAYAALRMGTPDATFLEVVTADGPPASNYAPLRARYFIAAAGGSNLGANAAITTLYTDMIYMGADISLDSSGASFQVLNRARNVWAQVHCGNVYTVNGSTSLADLTVRGQTSLSGQTYCQALHSYAGIHGTSYVNTGGSMSAGTTMYAETGLNSRELVLRYQCEVKTDVTTQVVKLCGGNSSAGPNYDGGGQVQVWGNASGGAGDIRYIIGHNGSAVHRWQNGYGEDLMTMGFWGGLTIGVNRSGALTCHGITCHAINTQNNTITCGAINANGTITGGALRGWDLVVSAPVYPGREDTGWTQQTSWWLASNASYGLKTNTGLRIDGSLNLGSLAYCNNVEIYQPQLRWYRLKKVDVPRDGDGYVRMDLEKANVFYCSPGYHFTPYISNWPYSQKASCELWIYQDGNAWQVSLPWGPFRYIPNSVHTTVYTIGTDAGRFTVLTFHSLEITGVVGGGGWIWVIPVGKNL